MADFRADPAFLSGPACRSAIPGDSQAPDHGRNRRIPPRFALILPFHGLNRSKRIASCCANAPSPACERDHPPGSLRVLSSAVLPDRRQFSAPRRAVAEKAGFSRRGPGGALPSRVDMPDGFGPHLPGCSVRAERKKGRGKPRGPSINVTKGNVSDHREIGEELAGEPAVLFLALKPAALGRRHWRRPLSHAVFRAACHFGPPWVLSAGVSAMTRSSPHAGETDNISVGLLNDTRRVIR